MRLLNRLVVGTITLLFIVTAAHAQSKPTTAPAKPAAAKPSAAKRRT